MYDDLFGKSPVVQQPRPSTPDHIRRAIRKYEARQQELKEMYDEISERYRMLHEHQLSYYHVLMNKQSCKCNFCKTLTGLTKAESMREMINMSKSRVSHVEFTEETISVKREMIPVSDIVDYYRVKKRLESRENEKEVIVLSEINGQQTRKRTIVSEHHDRIPIKTEKFVEKVTKDGKIKRIHVSDDIHYIPCKTETRKVYVHYTKGCLIDRGVLGIYYYIEWSESFDKHEKRIGCDLYLQHRWPISSKHSSELPSFLTDMACII